MASEPANRSKRNIAIGFAILQWLLLTFALGTMIIYTDQSMEGLLGYQLDSGYAFFGAIVIGFLIGATIERTKLLIIMVILTCVAAAGLYMAILYFPVWTGTIVHTVGLQNFASTRAMLYFGLAGVPVALGALTGRLLGPLIPGGDLLRRVKPEDAPRWWLDQAPRDDAQQEAPPSQ